MAFIGRKMSREVITIRNVTLGFPTRNLVGLREAKLTVSLV